jgi:hypothetical protein
VIRRRLWFGAFALLSMLSAALVFAEVAVPAGPDEPNDSVLEATGPVGLNQTYIAGLEGPSDRDFFYFYVTSITGSQVSLSIKNLGGGTESSDIDVTILDSSSTPVLGLAYIRKGEERVAGVRLKPAKYFIEVAPNEGYGDSYSLTAGGGAGAFGPYAQIGSRCSSASASVKRLHAGLEAARARLQRATGRLRRARYDTAAVRDAARSDFRKAKAHLTDEQKALGAATATESPWCFIPQ